MKLINTIQNHFIIFSIDPLFPNEPALSAEESESSPSVHLYPSEGNRQFYLLYVRLYPSKGNRQFFFSISPRTIQKCPLSNSIMFIFTNSKGNRHVFIFLVMSSLPILKVIDLCLAFL